QLYTLLLSRPSPPPPSTLFPYTTLFRSLSPAAMAITPLSAGNGTSVCRFDSSPQTATLPSLFNAILKWLPAAIAITPVRPAGGRSEEHTSELQSRAQLVCRLLLETKNPR